MKRTYNSIAFYILLVLVAITLATTYFLAQVGEEAKRQAAIEQEQGIQTFWRLARAKGDRFRIVGRTMMIGDYVVNGNFELPDTVSAIFDVTATVFMGDTRISTSVRSEDGSRAVGTKLVGPAYDAVFREGRPYRGETMILGIPYFTAYDPIRDDAGKVIGVLYVGVKKSDFLRHYGELQKDILISAVVIGGVFASLAFALFFVRRRYEEAIGESEAKYRSLFTHSPEAILLLTDTFIDCNDAACRLFGRERADIVGRSPSELSPPVQPDGRATAERERELIDAALRGGTELFPWRHLRRDGTPFEVEVSLRAVAFQGRRVLQATVRDMTAQKRSDRLQAGENRIMELIAGEAPLSEVLSQICLTIEGQIEGGLCSVLLVDQDGARLRHGAAPSLPDDFSRVVDGTRIGPAVGSCGTAAHCRSQVIASDIATDPNWAKYRRLPLSFGLRACWSAPITACGGELLGTFAVYYRTAKEPAPYELHLVERATHLAGIAIGRARSRATLEGNLRFLRVLIDTIPSPVFFKNAGGAYLGCNRAFSADLGLAEREIVGKTVYELAPPELAERYFAADRELFDAPGIQVYEAPVRFADGTVRQIIFHKATFDDQSGAVAGLVGVMLDITELRQTEQALRESEERFREIFEQNEDAIILLARENFAMIDANPAAEALFGHTRDELVRLGPWSFVAPSDYGTLIGAIPPPGDATPFHLDRIGAVRHDGSPIIASLWGKVVRLRSEEVVYCSIRDITDRVRMEEETRATQARLIHANKMTSLGVLVSGIAHEINNPNTFIQGNAGLLDKIWLDVLPLLTRHREEKGDFTLGGLPFAETEKVVPRLLYGLKEGSRRISAIIGNLKDFAREDTASAHAPIDVAAAVRDAALILSHHIHRHTDHFRLELPEALPWTLGKAQQVEQVVINLIMNALQALPGKDAEVRVSAHADGATSSVVIAVRDEGEGMTPGVMGRLTEPFFSTRLDRGGTGLGLSICASIIREHRGSLQFESSPGCGTTVTVTLPMAPSAAIPVNPADHGSTYEVQR